MMTSVLHYNIPILEYSRFKKCTVCNDKKPRSQFRKNRNGLRSTCKPCDNAATRLRREGNIDSERERNRRYYQDNRDKSNEKKARRRASKLQATPAWYEHEAVAALYKKSISLTAMGIDCHVDHIIPLQSNWVCGLHCFDNLQLLSPKENLSKGNRIDSASQQQ